MEKRTRGTKEMEYSEELRQQSLQEILQGTG
jgi:hypothetical protein